MEIRKITIKMQLLGLLLCAAPHTIKAAERTFNGTDPHTAIMITAGQPQPVTACTGSTVQFTFTPNSTTVISYSWQKNGTLIGNASNVSGATTGTLTIIGITADDAAAYRCVALTLQGLETSDTAYLNSSITAENATTTCLNSAATISVEAQGNTPQYQWYYNDRTNSNTGGTAIDGATSASYAPQTGQAGTFYYYAEVYPQGVPCAVVTSQAIAVTVNASAGGTVSGNQLICPNGTATVSVAGASGTVQWQQSADGVTGWANVDGGSGANTSEYTTPELAQSTYYRAVVNSLTCGTEYSDAVAVTVSDNYTWTGTISSDWSNSGNWSCNVVPNESHDVTIPSYPANQPVILSGIALAKSVTVFNNASLTIATGATLKITNEANVNSGGDFIIQDNAALVQVNTNANSGIISLHKLGNPLYRLDYTMWSSPVSGQQLQAFSQATSADRFYEYTYAYDTNTGANAEHYFSVSPSGNFVSGKSYLIRMPNADATTGYNAGNASITFEGVFTGTPANGDVNVNVLHGSLYTAVGNPYPSPISVTAFYDLNSDVLDQSSAIYLWRKRNNANATTYATVTLAGYTANPATGGGSEQETYFSGDSSTWLLAQGQGFIVKPKDNPLIPVITFNNSLRRPVPASGGQAFFRAQNSVSRLWLNLTANDGAMSQTAVAYIDGATTGLDYGYDGAQMSAGNSSTIYTLASEKNLAIQARPSFDDSDSVTVGYVAQNAGEFTVTLDHFEGVFANGQNIYLKDNVLGTVQNLNENNTYTFTTEAGTFNNRFEVVYTEDAALSVNNPVAALNTIIVYKDGSSIAVTAGNTMINGVTVYDIGGRMLYNNNKINSVDTTVTGLTATNQVVIVEVTTTNGKISKKVIL